MGKDSLLPHPITMEVLPLILEGRTVRLEPLRYAHACGFAEHADASLFKWFAGLYPEGATEDACEEYIRKRLALPGVRSFAVVLLETDRAVGHTSYMDIRPDHRSLEIGSTWYGRNHHGTCVNPECKLLMLRHAFEDLGCVRVQLKTDERNLQSQRAIEKLGAVREGVLRKHTVLPDDFVRNTVMYSITDDEWPAIKSALEQRIRQTISAP